MRLEVTEEYLLKLKLNKVRLCIIFLLFFYSSVSSAQDLQFNFKKDTRLSEALLLASKELHFKVAYDVGRLQNYYVPETITGKNVDDFLNHLLEQSGFIFLYKHGCYLIVEKPDIRDKETDQTIMLTGSIVDKETGEQLPFASVLVPEQNIHAIASSNGTFSVKDIVSNPVHLTINFIGYSSMDTSINLEAGLNNLVIALKPKAVSIQSVDIVKNRIDIIDFRDEIDFATTVNPSRLMDMPMTVETDIFRTLQLLPGVSYCEHSSELNIRGGTSDQNLVLFDGQTLYNLSHYYGVFSSINPSIVKDIQVFKGGFDSRYGERISGIVDISGKSGNQMKPSFAADINLLSINLEAEVPVTKKLTLVAAGRRSYSDIYSTSFADKLFEKRNSAMKSEPDDTVTVSEPSYYFYDVNAKVNYRISDQENLFISAYGGEDNYKNAYTLNSHAMHIATLDSNVWHNYGVSINWQKQWNPSFFSSLMVGASGYENQSVNSTTINRRAIDEQQQPYLPDSQNVFLAENTNELKDISVSSRNTLTINSNHMLNFGFLLRRNRIYYHKDADKVYVYDNINQSSWISSFYILDKISVSEKFIIKPGFRLTYYDGNRQVYLEPRLSARYSISDNLSLRMAAGRYNQFISQVASQQETGYTKNFWALSNDSVNPVLKASHFLAGLAWEKGKFFADAEVYFKKYSGQQEYVYLSNFLRNTDFDDFFPKNGPSPPVEESASSPSYIITGTGQSAGIDVIFGFKSRMYTGWISYSLGHSTQRFNMINQGAEIPSLTDQRHQISISNLVALGRWNLGSVCLFSTGRPYIAENRIEMGQSIERRYERLPNYFRCDVSANYRFSIKNVRLKTGVSVVNLFNSQNYFDVNTRTFKFESTTFSETNLVQSQRMALNIFLHINL
jgi:ferric enterobactin receptor